MKLLSLLCLIFLFSCEQQKSISDRRINVNQDLSRSYSKKEQELAKCADSIYKSCSGIDCFNKAKSQCLGVKGQRNPASSMAQIQAQAMIENNGWFFLNSEVIENFYNFIQTIKRANQEPKSLAKAKKYLSETFHGRGVGLSGAMFAGLRKGWSAELINHRNEVAVFCSPHNGLTTDVGISAGVVGVTTLGCGSNKHYEGAFLSANFGLSTEAFLVPAGVELAYSFGVNSKEFNSAVRSLKADKELNFNQLKNEIIILQASMHGSYPFLIETLNALSSFLFKEGSQDKTEKVNLAITKSLLKRKTSLGGIIKSFYYSEEFRNIISDNNLLQVDKILNVFAKSLTGCDSIAGSASLSLSVSPISFGLSQSYYTSLITLDKKDVKLLGGLSLASLANPILMSPIAITTILKYAFQINRIDNKLKACVGGDIKDFENFVRFRD